MAQRKSITPTDVYVGNRIRQRRMLMNLSQTALAEHLGLTFQQIQKYEKGANRVSASKLQETANFLNVSVAWFFEGGPNDKSKKSGAAEPWGNLLSTRDGIDLCTAFAKIKNSILRRRLVSLIEELAN